MMVTYRQGTIEASILRVPGEDGRGVYMAEAAVGESNRGTSFVETGEFRQTLNEAMSDLSAILLRHGATPDLRGIRPRLVHGGTWAPGELERQPGYNPDLDPNVLAGRFLNLLWAALPPEWQVEATGAVVRMTSPDRQVVERLPALTASELPRLAGETASRALSSR